jgi:sec-independent protein translocase protein TatA
MPGWIGLPELLLLLIVVLLVFGPKRLPEMGRSLGKGMREFKTAITGKEEDEQPNQLPAATPAPPETVAATSATREHDTV